MNTLMRTLTICTLSMAFTIAHADSSSTDPSKACFLSLSDNPDLSVLKDKIAISDVNSQTIEMLSNEKRPTAEDWMLQCCRAHSSKRKGADVAKFRSWTDCRGGITLERGADNRWRLFSARNQHSHELLSAMEDALGVQKLLLDCIPQKFQAIRVMWQWLAWNRPKSTW